MQLTIEQREEVESSLWVVNTALKRQGQSKNEDLRQSAILYMCCCRLRYNPALNVKWTTYAYRNVYLFIKRVLRKESIEKQMFVSNEFEKISNILPDKDQISPIEEDDNYLKNLCSKEERLIIQLKQQGFNSKEVAEKLGCSVSKINCCLQKIRNKIRDFKRTV